ncbi:MAG: preprotein translocase subunit SecG [Bacteroidales bacterium]|jgi:preprotein translocase subunit SecG|nr:preprotein translocase subunit SecG [Bacteroidales bacterium]
MAALIIILLIAACIILSLFVLIQNSKGGGLASNFASSNQIMGVRKTTETLEKGTWGVAAFIMLLCLVFAFMTHSEFKQNSERTQTEQTAE